MRRLGDMMTHVRLVARMARATDTDLAAAFDGKALGGRDWADIIDTCQRCPDAAPCDAWLTRRDGEDHPPAFCPNRDRFVAIKARGRPGRD